MIAAEVINQNSNDDDDICFVLDKHAELDVYRLLKQLSVCVEMFFHNLETVNTNFIVFGFTRPVMNKPVIF